jgi:hypothetical protein
MLRYRVSPHRAPRAVRRRSRSSARRFSQKLAKDVEALLLLRAQLTDHAILQLDGLLEQIDVALEFVNHFSLSRNDLLVLRRGVPAGFR